MSSVMITKSLAYEGEDGKRAVDLLERYDSK